MKQKIYSDIDGEYIICKVCNREKKYLEDVSNYPSPNYFCLLCESSFYIKRINDNYVETKIIYRGNPKKQKKKKKIY